MRSYQSVFLGSWGFEHQHYSLSYLGVSWQLLILPPVTMLISSTLMKSQFGAVWLQAITGLFSSPALSLNLLAFSGSPDPRTVAFVQAQE